MKYIFSGIALLAATTVARPQAVHYNNVAYPAGTGENLDFYPEPAGGWENVKYPPGTGAGAGGASCPPPPACPTPNDPAPTPQDPVMKFTSTYRVVARPDQVVNGTDNPVFTGGLPGAVGFYDLGINTDMDMICYNIRLVNYRGGYESAAATATHIHEAAAGQNGPPRIAFPNPTPKGDDFVSVGCLSAPFRTGLADSATGAADSGEGFSVSQIEANPSGFFADVHSSLAVPGAVRGQLA